MPRTPFAICFLASGLVASSAWADTLSNRHHLSGCAVQSAPIIIPHANVRTVQLGLPADLHGNGTISQVEGFRVRERGQRGRGGFTRTQSGQGATITFAAPAERC